MCGNHGLFQIAGVASGKISRSHGGRTDRAHGGLSEKSMAMEGDP